MSSRFATVLVIFIVAVLAFCLASVFASMTGPISILPNETESGGILDNLSAINTDTSNNNYNYQNYNDYSSDDSSDDDKDEMLKQLLMILVLVLHQVVRILVLHLVPAHLKEVLLIPLPAEVQMLKLQLRSLPVVVQMLKLQLDNLFFIFF